MLKYKKGDKVVWQPRWAGRPIPAVITRRQGIMYQINVHMPFEETTYAMPNELFRSRCKVKT